MKLFVSMSRPLAAAILLACGNRDTGDGTLSDTRAQDMRTVAPTTLPSVAAGQSHGPAANDLAANDLAADDLAADADALDSGEAGADGSIAVDGGTPYANDAGAPVLVGPCRACAESRCPQQFQSAVGAASSAENLAQVTQLFDCVIGENWELGAAIPAASCFFADPGQPLGSLLPCYCGSTPLGQCLATGPIDDSEACGVEVELASQCDPVAASCVTSAGSNPEVALGDALQLLNCQRAACPVECGFPPPPEE